MALFQMDFVSQSLKGSVSVNVVIPADPRVGYPPREDKPFKTLYLLHGLHGAHTHWLNLANTTAYAQLYDVAIVMPYGGNFFYLDHEKSGRMYSQFIGRELVDFTRRMFPLSKKREDTMIGGLSMGGFGAMYNGLRHNDVYGHIIALSSAILLRHMEATPVGDAGRGVDVSFYEDIAGGSADQIRETDKNLDLLAKQVLDGGKDIPDLYIACGYNDSLVYNNRNFSAHLDRIGYPHVYEEGAGTHDWDFWNPFLKRGLDRLDLAPKEIPLPPFWVDAESGSPNPVKP